MNVVLDYCALSLLGRTHPYKICKQTLYNFCDSRLLNGFVCVRPGLHYSNPRMSHIVISMPQLLKKGECTMWLVGCDWGAVWNEWHPKCKQWLYAIPWLPRWCAWFHVRLPRSYGLPSCYLNHESWTVLQVNWGLIEISPFVFFTLKRFWSFLIGKPGSPLSGAQSG